MSVRESLQANPVVPVVVVNSAEEGVNVGKALIAGGITTAEVTFRTAAAPEAIAEMSKIEGLNVGAGTVINAEQCERAIDAGATYIVSPGFSASVAKVCRERNVYYLPACTDGTHIMAALEEGLDTLKFFPAGAMGGTATLKALAAPFPQVRFMPTGGVSAANLAEYLALPCVLACGGSWMVSSALVKEGKWDEITRLSAEAVEIAKEAQA
ncbi:bifunctional 4-hydroxy-2-oxoglutarate aldolase/2-dehydro-3-deoxy-phosphogluconate aldolase [Actinomyces vulturis]|uniref:bifunctional 4-hydroxy-2-oxoglutarate aldolase/2-dehydro-3-deoxy-phosphogluconate aldolase n=1 Tax=Actinomyces vulturis TaxID=1857645 RepID=UPI0008304FBD|nr:bifunctional 4-hydroxy-2-oxoglutarate aldolase/2-dehydro-3-deoxy-phosphogluconate aldolase [Actinomyces vulturis]